MQDDFKLLCELGYTIHVPERLCNLHQLAVCNNTADHELYQAICSFYEGNQDFLQQAKVLM